MSLNIALLASPTLRCGPLSPLQRFARDFERFLEGHNVYTTEGCFRALLRAGVFLNHQSFFPTIPGYRGGIVRIAGGVLRDERGNPLVPESAPRMDVVVYLIDPRDPASNFPETNALKRECVVNSIPFLATSRSAREWAALTWEGASEFFLTESNSHGRAAFRAFEENVVALIAHDTKKQNMLKFVRTHFDVLLNLKGRIGTGTTATLLNGRQPEKYRNRPEWEKLRPDCEALAELIKNSKEKLRGNAEFVTVCKSGPEGGDVQIANYILERKCDVVIFFEDPHVAREHETDIQLLERTGRVRGRDVICIHDERTARDFAEKWRTRAKKPEALLVATALERAFGVKAVLVESGKSHGPHDTYTWDSILRGAAWVLFSEIVTRARERRSRGEKLRVTTSWGVGMSELISKVKEVPRRLAELEMEVLERLRRTLRENEREAKRGRVLEVEVVDKELMEARNVVAGPMQGVMAAEAEEVEANVISRALADCFLGESVAVPVASVLRASVGGQADRRERVAGIGEHWQRTDVLITGCAPVREESGRQVHAPQLRGYYHQVKDSAGDFGGIYLHTRGQECRAAGFERVGMSVEEVKSVKGRGGSFLVVGREESRLEIARAALLGDLVSVLITDLEFGRRLLLR